jgi:RimJ/RimL family protein N-acetyltransferase
VTSLRSERLILRPFEERDLEPFAAMNAHPDVVATLGSTPTRAESDDMVVRWTAELEREGWGLWVLEVVGGAPFVGVCGLHGVNEMFPFARGVEVGWRLSPDHWRHGYATEAALAALDHGFGTVGLEEIVSFTAAINVRSQAVMQRIGMTRDLSADFEHPTVPEDSPLRPHVLYRIQPGRTVRP